MNVGKIRRWAGVRGLLVALVVAGALVAAAISTAAQSSEATTFGADGIALASLGSNYVETAFTRVTANADGSVVAERPGEVETFLADGAPDPAAPPVAVGKKRKVYPAAGGKSYVAEGSKLTRLNADGTPDTSFATNGVLTADLHGLGDFAKDVAIDSQGRIVAAGYTANGSGTEFALLRANP